MTIKKERDWPSIGSILLAVLLAICTAAAAWGATKAEVKSTETQVAVIQIQLDKTKDIVNDIRIVNSATEQSLKDISKKLEDLSRQLEELNKTITRTWRDSHGR